MFNTKNCCAQNGEPGNQSICYHMEKLLQFPNSVPCRAKRGVLLILEALLKG